MLVICYLVTFRLLCLRLICVLFGLVSNCVSLVGLTVFKRVDLYDYFVCLLCLYCCVSLLLVTVVVLLVIVLFLFGLCSCLVGLLLVRFVLIVCVLV